jgi:hypothetical protein
MAISDITAETLIIDSNDIDTLRAYLQILSSEQKKDSECDRSNIKGFIAVLQKYDIEKYFVYCTVERVSCPYRI